MLQTIVSESMRLWRRPARCCALLMMLAGNGALAQVPPEETVQFLRTAPAFDVSLFASEPMITNPTAIDIDAHGRVWVCEGQYYRRRAEDPGIDKIKVLEDTDGDGRADRATVFTDDLLVPMSVCVAGTTVYVAESPHVWTYEDRDGDLRADPGSKKVFLKGFRGRNHDHGVHGLMIGPDNKLYMTNGDSGFDVTGPDGRRIQYQWGAMIRCNLDGTGLEMLAHNFRNPYEIAVDSFGNMWCSDNDNDGLRSVRICWILEGGNYGWYGHPLDIRNADGSYDVRYHWRIDTLGIVPYVLPTGFGSPCGIIAYESDVFGPRYRGQFLHADAGPREVRCYHVEKKGAGFEATSENILTTEGDPYFRPVDVAVAPDGSLLVPDWYDGGVGGHAYNNPDQGRIYHLRPKRRMPEQLVKRGPYETVADAIVGLKSPNAATRYLAQSKLIEAGDDALTALHGLAHDDNDVFQARALWMLDAIGSRGRRVVEAHLGHSDGAFRALAVRILRRHGQATLESLLPLADDDDAEVRREVLLALRGQKSRDALSALQKLIEQWDGDDRFYLEAINIAAEAHKDQLAQESLARLENGEYTGRSIALAQILGSPESVAPLLIRRLASDSLSEASAHGIIEALSRMDTTDAGQAILDALNKDVSDTVKGVALDALHRKLGSAWQGLRTRDAMASALRTTLQRPDLRDRALRMAGDFAIPGLSDSISDLAVSSTLSETERRAAIDALGRVGGDGALPTLRELLADESETIRGAAVAGLVTLRAYPALRELILGDDQPDTLRHHAIRRLTRESDGCFFLLPLLDKKQIPESLAKQVIASAVDHPDVNVRLLYQKFVPPSERPKTLGQAVTADEILEKTGNVSRGRNVFYFGSARCRDCHRVRGRGRDIGPDLTQIGRKYERGELLDTILHPSKAIAPEFVPHVIETESMGVVVGFIMQQSPERLVIKTDQGARLVIERDDVVDMAAQQTSLMPELLLGGYTAQDAADLLAFLESLR